MSDIIVHDHIKGKRYSFTNREFAQFLEYFQERNEWHFSLLTHWFAKRSTRNRINRNWCQLTLVMR